MVTANPKLSIILPCYNVGNTLRRAVDSILMQRTNFDYEIIFVNDASTDDTLAIMQEYAASHPNITVLDNKTNLKNARTFSRGLKAAKGDYFCVLDGDDYYTNRDKLQRQIDFLDADKPQEYVGVAHYFVVDTENGRVNFNPLQHIDEFNYADFLNERSDYYHTSTYVYRNIFRDAPLPLFDLEQFRGDTPRTLFHLKFSNKKIKVLPFVGSAYSFTGTGIWSAMSQRAQTEYQINLYRNFEKVFNTNFEQAWVDRMVNRYGDALGQTAETRRKYPTRTIDQCLQQAGREGAVFTHSEKDFIFNGAYFSDYLDSAAATIGEVFRTHNPGLVPYYADPNSVVLVCSYLVPQGGGIFREIKELIELYSKLGKKVNVIVSQANEPSTEAIATLESCPGVKVRWTFSGEGSNIERLHQAFLDASPSRAYFYLHHHDFLGQTLIQRGDCLNIIPFSFDHGFLSGIANPNVDKIIAKRPIDYQMLQDKFGEKVQYIPTANKPPAIQHIPYQPFRNHKQIITASGSARFYKLGGTGTESYLDLIIDLLKKTGGKHYHLGPIPDEIDEEISRRLADAGLSETQFVRLGWVDNFVEALLVENVDLFIEPFPVVSYKLTLDLYAAGIPVISRAGLGRMGTVDFTYPGNLTWRDREEFLNKISGLKSDELAYHSDLSKTYFAENHTYDALLENILSSNSVAIPPTVNCLDASIHDVYDYAALFPQKKPFISITPPYELPS